LAVPGGVVSFCPEVRGRIGACIGFTAGRLVREDTDKYGFI